ncbi:unnamed protein product, partial [Symbiodinium pilosum]
STAPMAENRSFLDAVRARVAEWSFWGQAFWGIWRSNNGSGQMPNRDAFQFFEMTGALLSSLVRRKTIKQEPQGAIAAQALNPGFPHQNEGWMLKGASNAHDAAPFTSDPRPTVSRA